MSIQINDAAERNPHGEYRPMVDRLLPGNRRLELSEIAAALLPRMEDPRIGVEVFNGGLRRLPRQSAAEAALAAARSVLSRSPG
jgi:hypothetical protein